MVQFEEKYKAGMPTSIVSELALESEEVICQRIVAKIMTALAIFVAVCLYLTAFICLLNLREDPDSEWHNVFVWAYFACAIVATLISFVVLLLKEISNKYLRPDLEAGLPSEETSLIDIES
ncbi:uncharacterized protein NECHADRAFT_78140 [Fusarium vanettenii 77-13-4]|uniref:Uncharacterized protein n=1 Tax=Fusarium vanettenii (strain ATCC MYA-4622 / CBS 123669 / FGSC 9596 / NRRL 45880 / 77-13-4) TaxID=660122 RepID=C7YN84_FUSV7|nr:uncharacterized protein NECHADRAFT_78140 [Fusarium vanettenii 77-13-4]EEU47580.1 predicted protein [Fusarium vanettenii 77-13-4]